MSSDDRPQDEREQHDLEESAEAIGVDPSGKDPDEIVEEVRHAQADSESSPSEWKQRREEGAA